MGNKTVRHAAVYITVVLIGMILIQCRSRFGRYNFVLIVSDALRKDILGCYGGEALTPNIDWLAENGAVFEKAYSTAPSTMPSSISMLSGHYSRCYGVVPNQHLNLSGFDYIFHVNDSEILLGDFLSRNGYSLRMNIENGLAERANNIQGFLKYGFPKEMSAEDKQIVEEKIPIRCLNWEYWDPLSFDYDKMYPLLHHLLTLEVTERFGIIKWFKDPHEPYSPPDKFLKRIDYDTSTLTQAQEFYSNNGLYIIRKKIPPSEYPYLKRIYQAEVEAMDERLGFILDALKQRRLLEKTFVIFTSDHGEFFGEKGRISHGDSFLEPLVNVPLVIYGPNVKKGQRITSRVSLLGLMPTLKELLGAEFDDDAQGWSFAPLLKGKTVDDQEIYFDMISNRLLDDTLFRDALIMDGYKLVCSKRKGKVDFTLYDLDADPAEEKNIEAVHPDRVRKMWNRILEICKENYSD